MMRKVVLKKPLDLKETYSSEADALSPVCADGVETASEQEYIDEMKAASEPSYGDEVETGLEQRDGARCAASSEQICDDRTEVSSPQTRTAPLFSRIEALAAAFFIPVLILAVISAARGIYPFGDNAMLRTDMYHQYAPFFSELRYKLTGGGSLHYTWDIGLGVNFAAIYAYYLASPLNLLLAFCPQEHVLEFMAAGIVLRIALCGLSMCWYMLHHVRSNTMTAAFAGIFYALSGYISAYYWNIMWLDCIALFPLICLGVEKLIRDRRGLLYVISLGACIWTNYYISMMVCVFMVIYFAMMLIMERPGSLKAVAGAALRFGFYSLLAGGLAAVVILPGVMTLKSTAAATTTFPQTVQHYFSCIDMIARHMLFVKNEEGLDHWPNIYCGVAVIPLVVLWLRSECICLKEKLVYGLAMLLFLASFALNVLNYMWHGFHYPNSLPARMSFIYIFLVLYACGRALDGLEAYTRKDINKAFAFALLFVALCQKIVTDDAFTWDVFYATAGCLALYWMLMSLRRDTHLRRVVLTLVTLGVVAAEAALNMSSTSITTVKRSTYLADNAFVRNVVAYAYENDPDFYRFEKVTRKTKDDGAWMNFRSVSIFSSVTDAGISDFFKDMGCESSVNAYSITGSTPFVDALLDVRYGIYSQTPSDPQLELVDQSGDIYLYRNPYTLPLGFCVSQNLLDNWIIDTGSPIHTHNDICDVCGIEERMLEKVDGDNAGSIFTASVTQTGLYYAYSDSTSTKNVTSRIDGETRTYSNLNRGYLMELGYLEAGTDIELTATDDTSINVRLYRFNYEALKKVTEYLGSAPMKITGFDDTHIEGRVTAAKDGSVLFTTIPYEKGWSVYVDGERAEATEIYDSFIGVKLNAGEHSISFSYEPEGWRTGIYISLASLAVLGVAAVVTVIRRRRGNAEAQAEDLQVKDGH